MWIAVTRRFNGFHTNLSYTDTQENEGVTHALGVIKTLNRHYYDNLSETDNGFFVGSWAKKTKIRPPGDIDLYFKLPYSVYERYQLRTGNKQSALLQEVKIVLESTFPNTNIKGDGPVVAINFNSQNVELVPVFELSTGGYYLCNTKDGGSYMTADPNAEYHFIERINRSCAGNLIPLIMMIKCWKRACNVPIKSFYIELVAADFLIQYIFREKNVFYYDWMVRDYFVYLYSKANQYITVPGTNEYIFLGDDWKSRVETAYSRAVKACEFEQKDMVVHAGRQWQLIFENQIPLGEQWSPVQSSLLMNV